MATVDITYYTGADSNTRMLPDKIISRAVITIGTGNQYAANPANAEVAVITARSGDAMVTFNSNNATTPDTTNSQLILSGGTFQKSVTASTASTTHYIIAAAG
jgi:hypothetical protein